MTAGLPVESNWFRVRLAATGVTRVDEPWVNEFLRANIWHIRGTERDLVVDSGLGVAPLREHVPELFDHAPILVVTHSHLDHSGSAWEFEDRRSHALERLEVPPPASLHGPRLAALLGSTWTELPALLVDAVPSADFDLDAYSVRAAPPTSVLNDGDLIELGDRTVEVLHLPGHSPGSCVLFDASNHALFSGDVLYNDELLDDLTGSNIEDYLSSMRRLRGLDVETVFPGHGEPFDGRVMRELIDKYVASRTT